MTTKPPPIPKKHTKTHKVHFWGSDYTVTPAVVEAHHGDGKLLMWFAPLNTRPNYYLVRVDSRFFKCDEDDVYYKIESVVIEMIEEEFSEKEREREYLADDLRAQGIEPDHTNTDLAGNEDRLGWPVLSLDSGYSWGVVCRLGRQSKAVQR
jgi:hypothetical protein